MGLPRPRGRTADSSSVRSAEGLHRPKPMQATAERERRSDRVDSAAFAEVAHPPKR